MEHIKPTYSVIIPVFNSENLVEELMNRLVHTMEKFGPYELIFVDDLSTDSSWQNLVKAKGNRQHIRLIRLTNNFGQANALLCGLHHAAADTLINIDDDLQFQPEDIELLIKHFDPEKHYVLFGVPKKKSFSFPQSLFSRLAQYLFRFILKDSRQKVDVSSFRIFKRYERPEEYSEKTMQSVHVFFEMVSPVLMDFIYIDTHLKRKGNSTYSLRKKIQILQEFLLTTSRLPELLLNVSLYSSGFLLLLSIVLSIQKEHIPYNWGLSLIFLCFFFLFLICQVFMFYLKRTYLSKMGGSSYAIWEEK